MTILTHDAIADFTATTISNFRRLKYTDISLEHTEYVSADILDEKRVVEDGGDTIKFDIKKSNTGTARNTGLYAADVTNDEDVMTQGSVPWTKQTANWSYDIDLPEFQTERDTIIRLLQVKEHNALNDMVELNEQNLWTAPTSTSDKRPMGIPYWIVKDATTTPGGAFNGGNPASNSAGAAGVSSTTYPRWRNWTFGFANASTDDLVAKIKKAKWSTNFMAPNPHPQLGYGKADYVIYTTYRVAEPLERLAETRNDNLGADLAKYINTVVVGGTPIKAVPYLEANDTSDPVYGINWKQFRPYVKSGIYMRRTGPFRAAKQHTVREVHLDTWMNYCSYDRRSLWVGSKS